MKHVLKSWLWAMAFTAVTVTAGAEVLRDQDFRAVINTAGASVWPTVTGNNRSGSQNNAFDGIKFSDETSKRWLSSFKDFGVFGDGSGKESCPVAAEAENLGRRKGGRGL